MADIRVTETHALATDEAAKRVKNFEEMLTKYRVKAKWDGPHADLSGPGVSGSIDVTASAVTVLLKLGLLARAAGVDPERLKGSIQRRLGEALKA